jgi:hypothetical protein
MQTGGRPPVSFRATAILNPQGRSGDVRQSPRTDLALGKELRRAATSALTFMTFHRSPLARVAIVERTRRDVLIGSRTVRVGPQSFSRLLNPRSSRERGKGRRCGRLVDFEPGRSLGNNWIRPQRGLRLWCRSRVRWNRENLWGAETRSCAWAKRTSRIWSHYASITADRQSKHAFQESSNTPEWYLIPRAAFALMALPLVIQYRVKA